MSVLTRTQVLQSNKFLQLMELPNRSQISRIEAAIANAEVLFEGWTIQVGTINDNDNRTLPTSGDIIIGSLTNGAADPITGSLQSIYYLSAG